MPRPSRCLLRGVLPLAASLLILGGCESEATQPDPTQVKLNQLDQRVGQIERVVSNQSLVQLSERIDQLDMQLRELRGEVEELQNGSDALRKQQRDFYSALDRRIATLEVASKAAVPALPAAGASPNLQRAGTRFPVAPTNATGAVNGGQAALTDQSAYEQAFNTLKSQDYPAAVRQFSDFLHQYPHSDLDDNAQYWLGEAYYVQRDYADAAGAFRAVEQNYPQSRKAPDALLKLGYTQFDQQQLADARATFNQVIQLYPTSDAAKLATQRLAQLPANGAAGAPANPP